MPIGQGDHALPEILELPYPETAEEVTTAGSRVH